MQSSHYIQGQKNPGSRFEELRVGNELIVGHSERDRRESVDETNRGARALPYLSMSRMGRGLPPNSTT